MNDQATEFVEMNTKRGLEKIVMEQALLRATKGRMLWRAMFTYVLKGHST